VRFRLGAATVFPGGVLDMVCGSPSFGWQTTPPYVRRGGRRTGHPASL